MSTSEEIRRTKIEQGRREMRLMSSFGALLTQALAERVGMHSTDMETMDLLNTLGPMTAGELSRRSGLTSGATTRLIDRLERAGYVRRQVDEADRRCVIIAPVPDNLEPLIALFQPLIDRITELWSKFDDDELDVIVEFARQSNALVSDFNARLRGTEADGPCD